MRGLGRVRTVDRSVIGDDADSMTFDGGMAANGLRAITGAEFEEVGIFHQSGNHFLHVHRATVVGRHDPEQILGRIARRLKGSRRRCRQRVIPAQLGNNVAGNTDGVAIILREVITETADAGMHLGTAEFFFRRDFAGRGLEQRWPCKEVARSAAHHHDVVGQAGLVGAARSR